MLNQKWTTVAVLVARFCIISASVMTDLNTTNVLNAPKTPNVPKFQNGLGVRKMVKKTFRDKLMFDVDRGSVEGELQLILHLLAFRQLKPEFLETVGKTWEIAKLQEINLCILSPAQIRYLCRSVLANENYKQFDIEYEPLEEMGCRDEPFSWTTEEYPTKETPMIKCPPVIHELGKIPEENTFRPETFYLSGYAIDNKVAVFVKENVNDEIKADAIVSGIDMRELKTIGQYYKNYLNLWVIIYSYAGFGQSNVPVPDLLNY